MSESDPDQHPTPEITRLLEQYLAGPRESWAEDDWAELDRIVRERRPPPMSDREVRAVVDLLALRASLVRHRVPGLAAGDAARLAERFGSLRRLADAGEDDIRRVVPHLEAYAVVRIRQIAMTVDP